MKKRILALMVGLCTCFAFTSCGGGGSKTATSSGLQERVLASQGVSSSTSFGSMVILNGKNDTIPRVAPLSAGSAPGLMAVSPARNVAAAFDANSNTVFAVDTTKETAIGSVRLTGPTYSMVIPTSSQVGYAAVPSATVTGYSFLGAIEGMSFSNGAISQTIPVANAQTVVAASSQTSSSSTSIQLLVFSNDSDSIAVVNPQNAVPPVDFSCYNNTFTGVCTLVSGFDRPVYGIINGSTAYILNCGPQCGGTQASVMVFDLGTLTVTQTIPVDAATFGFLNNSTLYVAGTSPTNNGCAPQQTAATICGRLDVIDLNSGTVSGSAVITDGFHDHMDMTTNGQLFIGSRGCTNVGNVNSPSGEVRGCLSIFKTADGSVIVPPDNGDVNGLQGFTTRNVEYVAEGGALRVYDTNKDILLINTFLPQGSINIVGYVGDVKAIDFF